MPTKRKVVDVARPDLLDECRNLLESRLIGESLSNSKIISSALLALRNQCEHQLISVNDCRALSTKNTTLVCVRMLERLMDAGLLQIGEYEIEGHPTEGYQIKLDGQPIPEKPGQAAPDWVADLVNQGQKKRAAH